MLRRVVLGCLVFALAGCYKRNPLMDTPEFKALGETCPRQHMYWRIRCDTTKPHCTATAWVGAEEEWKEHDSEWSTSGDNPQEAASKLLAVISGPPNKEPYHKTFDSGLQQCKPPLKAATHE